MIKNLFFRLCLILAVMLSLHSCRQEDLAIQNNESQRNNADFFKHNIQNGSFAKSGVDYIKILEDYNTEKNFLSAMPDQEGMPVWEKMMVFDTENKTSLMIPLSHEENIMSSVLFVNLDGGNQVKNVQNVDNRMLENLVNDTGHEATVREGWMSLFLMLDQHTFGTKEFTNIPEGLFEDGVKGPYNRLHVRSFDHSVEEEPTSHRMIITVCTVIWNCKENKSWENCDKCAICLITSKCTHTTIDLGNIEAPFPPGTTIPIGSGGGSTPQPNIPKPNDPCAPSGAFYRIIKDCDASTGGGNEPVDGPCEKTKTVLASPQIQAKINDLKNQSSLPYTDPNYGEAGYKFDSNGMPTPKIIGGKHHVDLGTAAGYQGGYHNHTLSGVKMLAPGDIVSLLSFSMAQPNGNIGDGYLGMIGSEVCSSCPGGIKYYHYVISFSGNAQELQGFLYNTNWDLENLTRDYRDREYELSGNLLYVNNLGDDLNNQGLEKLFFDTLKNMGMEGKVNLQRIENDGTVKNVTLNGGGNTTSATPCPN